MVRVKLGDFGTSVKLVPGKLARSKVGTPAFMAPEMHLLPGRSPGYDHKVDVWAAGVVMVFLLANEYPFIDGAGRLLRQKIINGDVPVWETGTFQDMFIGFQEAVGMRRKRPSRLARDMALRLLCPARQNRTSAGLALRHQWFKGPVAAAPEGNESDVSQGIQLLDWQDFEDGLAVVGRDLQWAVDMMTGSRVAVTEVGLAQGCHNSFSMGSLGPVGATVDDPLKTCVVCYSLAGGVGYTCPQCCHSVCGVCVAHLPKAACPYCRKDAPDMPIASRMQQFPSNSAAVGALLPPCGRASPFPPDCDQSGSPELFHAPVYAANAKGVIHSLF